MTTANCCQYIDGLDIKVFAGLYAMQNLEDGTQVVGITSVYIHEDFDSQTLVNDICLVTLDTELQFDEL